MNNIIEYVIKSTGLTQAAIARELNISRAQVTKWKAGEYMSSEKEDMLIKLANMFTSDVEWQEFAENEKNANAWYEYFQELRDISGYELHNYDDPDINIPIIVSCIQNAGIELPKNPKIIKEGTPLSEWLFDFSENYGRYLEYWVANLASWQFDDEENLGDFEFDNATNELEHWCIRLAIRNTNSEKLEAVDKDRLAKYDSKTFIKGRMLVKRFCDILSANGVEPRADYYQFVSEDSEWLEDEDMFSSLTFNVSENMSFANKQLLKDSEDIKKLLVELHLKIDTLLSKENAEMLSKELELTPPLGNVHLKGQEEHSTTK